MQPTATDLQPGSFDRELKGLHDCVESFPLGSATSAYGKLFWDNPRTIIEMFLKNFFLIILKKILAQKKNNF